MPLTHSALLYLACGGPRFPLKAADSHPTDSGSGMAVMNTVTKMTFNEKCVLLCDQQQPCSPNDQLL